MQINIKITPNTMRLIYDKLYIKFDISLGLIWGKYRLRIKYIKKRIRVKYKKIGYLLASKNMKDIIVIPIPKEIKIFKITTLLND